MNPGDFHYELPEALIAQAPLAERKASRLLHLSCDAVDPEDLQFGAIHHLLKPGDLLVVNNTRVLPARLFGRKASGGKVEILLERALDDTRALVQLRASRSPQTGTELHVDTGESEPVTARVLGRHDEFFEVRFAVPVTAVFEAHGHVPLPPYIRRADVLDDRERYQTVYAEQPGAVAAPTAGLHFDRGLLNQLRANGVDVVALTLHVGAGTFAPLRQANIDAARLHAERLEVPEAVCAKVRATRRRGGRVIAVGTTTARGLETASMSGECEPFDGETSLFIMPGHEFRAVDALITNFHLPESSLLMLVCAFAGTERVLRAYRHAVEQRYRFFSYGDAMFCERFETRGQA